MAKGDEFRVQIPPIHHGRKDGQEVPMTNWNVNNNNVDIGHGRPGNRVGGGGCDEGMAGGTGVVGAGSGGNGGSSGGGLGGPGDPINSQP